MDVYIEVMIGDIRIDMRYCIVRIDGSSSMVLRW